MEDCVIRSVCGEYRGDCVTAQLILKTGAVQEDNLDRTIFNILASVRVQKVGRLIVVRFSACGTGDKEE